MPHHSPYLSHLEVPFCLQGEGDQDPACLSLVPMGFEKYDPPIPPDAWLVYVQLKLKAGGLECSWHDLLEVGQLQELRARLAGFTKGVPGSLKMRAHEGGFALDLRWREAERDVVVAGRIPSTDYEAFWAFRLNQDPLLFRKRIKTSVTFEFWMPPENLEEPVVQLDALLASIQSPG